MRDFQEQCLTDYVPFDGMFDVILFEKNKRKSKSQVYMTHYPNDSTKNIMVFPASANVKIS